MKVFTLFALLVSGIALGMGTDTTTTTTDIDTSDITGTDLITTTR